MAEFFGTAQGARKEQSCVGGKASGMRTSASSWQGAVVVELTYDPKLGRGRYVVEQRVHHGAGIRQHLAAGIIGEVDKGAAERMAASAALDRIAATMSNLDLRDREIWVEVKRILAASGRTISRKRPAPIPEGAPTLLGLAKRVAAAKAARAEGDG